MPTKKSERRYDLVKGAEDVEYTFVWVKTWLTSCRGIHALQPWSRSEESGMHWRSCREFEAGGEEVEDDGRLAEDTSIWMNMQPLDRSEQRNERPPVDKPRNSYSS